VLDRGSLHGLTVRGLGVTVATKVVEKGCIMYTGKSRIYSRVYGVFLTVEKQSKKVGNYSALLSKEKS